LIYCSSVSHYVLGKFIFETKLFHFYNFIVRNIKFIVLSNNKQETHYANSRLPFSKSSRCENLLFSVFAFLRTFAYSCSRGVTFFVYVCALYGVGERWRRHCWRRIHLPSPTMWPRCLRARATRSPCLLSLSLARSAPTL
jgi:hypothetical protein